MNQKVTIDACGYVKDLGQKSFQNALDDVGIVAIVDLLHNCLKAETHVSVDDVAKQNLGIG